MKITWKLYFVLVMALNTLGLSHDKFLSANDYLLGIQQRVRTFNVINVVDKPYTISNAAITTPVNIQLPSLVQMMYYNYYTASVNCPYQVQDLSCYYCDKIKNDITHYILLDSKAHDTNAMVAVSENRQEIVITFRATENIWNVLLDASFIDGTPYTGDNIKIHKGFYIAVMSLYADVVKTVGAFRKWKKAYKSYKIVIAGHSLGAGMARVTSFFLISLKQFPGATYEVYTYGEPRSGNKAYVDYLNRQYITTARCTSRADIVCHIPPVSILGTDIIYNYYYHVLNEYWINGNVSKFADPSVYEDINCSDSLGPLYTPLDHFTYFDVDQSYCLADFVEEFTAIPYVILPVEDVPELPTFIQILLSDVGILLTEIVTPILG